MSTFSSYVIDVENHGYGVICLTVISYPDQVRFKDYKKKFR